MAAAQGPDVRGAEHRLPECGGELRFRALVQDPYVASPELVADMQGFDVSDILDVEDLLLDPVAGSSLA